ncbi:hypothetical protein L2E82_44059 [Cichorium intybus]|uniref:Uncharacterized protein n=1 Tax=Cichorium intybus TaxID=13427 RepID=A0ACB8ZPR1_CICIN|nr:hypothetical protein L2E82_44059 [Cichorium intybus]
MERVHKVLILVYQKAIGKLSITEFHKAERECLFRATITRSICLNVQWYTFIHLNAESINVILGVTFILKETSSLYLHPDPCIDIPISQRKKKSLDSATAAASSATTVSSVLRVLVITSADAFLFFVKSKMNFNNRAGVSFLKKLPSDSVDYLPLPSAFAEKYLEKGNNKKQTLVLEPKSAVKWSVKYFKIEDKYYFMDGWIKFIKDNRLQVGDFLVFRLLAASPKSIFQVIFYAPNGCLKHPVTSTGNFSLNRKDSRPLVVYEGTGKKRIGKEETSGDDDDSNKLLTKVLRKSSLHRLPMNKGFWKANGLHQYEYMRLRTDKEGKIWKVEVRKYGRMKYLFLTRGWNDFWNDKKLEIGNILRFSHVKDNLFHVHVIKRQKGKKTSRRNASIEDEG